MKHSEVSLSELRDTLREIGVFLESQTKRGIKGERAENLFKKIMAEKDSNLERDIFIQLHEAYRCPNRFNPEKTSLRHVIIKLSKIQGRGILTAAREKELAAYGELP